MELSALIGEVLVDRELVRLLGQGGYGAVFEARNVNLERREAVKLLYPRFADASDSFIERFRAEARATARLNHANSVLVYNFGEIEAQGQELLYLAMEYLDGQSLNDLLKARGPLDLELTLHIVEQMAATLHDAHTKGIVHRDVKPHNVMIVERGGDPHFVKVIDFGIAKVVQETSLAPMETLTGDDQMIGTPHYMAPEQIQRGEEVDARTDVYALACCTYKLLTGRTPFDGGTHLEIVLSHLQEEPPPLDAIDPDIVVPGPLQDVLLRALAKDRAARFDTALAFATALRAAAGGAHSASESGASEQFISPTSPTVETTLPGETAPMRTPPEQERPEAFAPTSSLEAPADAMKTPALRGQDVRRVTNMMFPIDASEVNRRLAEQAPEQDVASEAPEVSSPRAVSSGPIDISADREAPEGGTTATQAPGATPRPVMKTERTVAVTAPPEGAASGADAASGDTASIPSPEERSSARAEEDTAQGTSPDQARSRALLLAVGLILGLVALAGLAALATNAGGDTLAPDPAGEPEPPAVAARELSEAPADAEDAPEEPASDTAGEEAAEGAAPAGEEAVEPPPEEREEDTSSEEPGGEEVAKERAPAEEANEDAEKSTRTASATRARAKKPRDPAPAAPQEEPEVRAEPKQKGELVANVIPAGKVYLDGKLLCPKACTKAVDAGRHEVHVVFVNGERSRVQKVTVKPGARATLTFNQFE